MSEHDDDTGIKNGKAWDPQAALQSLAAEREVLGDRTLVRVAEDLLEENLPTAVMAIVHLSQFASSDSIRLKAAQYLVDRGLGRPGLEGLTGKDQDPFERFLAECVSEQEQESAQLKQSTTDTSGGMSVEDRPPAASSTLPEQTEGPGAAHTTADDPDHPTAQGK